MFLFRKLKLDELLPKFTGGAALCAKFASAIDAILALFGKETLNKSQKNNPITDDNKLTWLNRRHGTIGAR